MAEPDYAGDQFPTIDLAPRAPQREYARLERVADWESVKSGSLAVLPPRDDHESSLDPSDLHLVHLEPQCQLPAVSVVVPTRNEADNVEELVRRLERAVPGLPMEIIFVDDSTDETPDAIEALRGHYHPETILVHRPEQQRGDGLGGAVVRGLQIARAPWVCVMDADLQHPPELLPQMLAAVKQDSVDLVVASRYCGGGETNSFGRLRASISHGTTNVARAMFPNRLRNVTDPMSGFFLVRRDSVNLDALQPNGFKILLEIIGRSPGLRTTEVPFQFGTRHAGESKASLREGLRFFQLLLCLRLGPGILRLARFGLVGISGLVINALVLGFATEALGIFYLLSALIATQASTLWNFGLSEAWVFGHRHSSQGRPRRLAMFFVMNNAAFALRGPMIIALTSILGIHYLTSNLLSLIVLMILRYAVADRFIWSSPQYAPSLETSDGVTVPVALAAD
jgi:glycosyltransferase involved in cell wall biosynthesis